MLVNTFESSKTTVYWLDADPAQLKHSSHILDLYRELDRIAFGHYAVRPFGVDPLPTLHLFPLAI